VSGQRVGSDEIANFSGGCSRLLLTAYRLLFCSETGRSAARLARLLREQEVPGSNPGAPIVKLLSFYELVSKPKWRDWQFPPTELLI
jgi:hypothetical protein